MTASGQARAGSAGDGEPAVLPLLGDVDALTQARYRDAADALLSTGTTRRLVLDLGRVQTIDSSGLGLLVHVHASALDHDAAMSLRNVPPRVDALLRRTGLDPVFAVEDRG